MSAYAAESSFIRHAVIADRADFLSLYRAFLCFHTVIILFSVFYFGSQLSDQFFFRFDQSKQILIFGCLVLCMCIEISFTDFLIGFFDSRFCFADLNLETGDLCIILAFFVISLSLIVCNVSPAFADTLLKKSIKNSSISIVLSNDYIYRKIVPLKSQCVNIILINASLSDF